VSTVAEGIEWGEGEFSPPVVAMTPITEETRRRSESAYIRQVHDNVMINTSTRLHKHLPSNVLAQ